VILVRRSTHATSAGRRRASRARRRSRLCLPLPMIALNPSAAHPRTERRLLRGVGTGRPPGAKRWGSSLREPAGVLGANVKSTGGSSGRARRQAAPNSSKGTIISWPPSSALCAPTGWWSPPPPPTRQCRRRHRALPSSRHRSAPGSRRGSTRARAASPFRSVRRCLASGPSCRSAAPPSGRQSMPRSPAALTRLVPVSRVRRSR
jgi:hypothetical protein